MSLRISPLTYQNKYSKPSFGVSISKADALAILTEHPEFGEKEVASVYLACASILGPDQLGKGVKAIIGKCAEILRPNLPESLRYFGRGMGFLPPGSDLVQISIQGQTGKIAQSSFEIKPVFEETEASRKWLDDAKKALQK